MVQTFIVKVIAVSICLTLIVLGGMALSAAGSLIEERKSLEREIVRIEIGLADANNRFQMYHAEVAGIEALPSRSRRLAEGRLNRAKHHRELLRDEIRLLSGLKTLNQSIIESMHEPMKRLDFELQRYDLILTHKANWQPDGSLQTPSILLDPLYFIYLSQTEKSMLEKQRLYQVIKMRTSEGVPFQNPFPELRGCTGFTAMARMMKVPVSYIFFALTVLLPTAWLVGLFESGVIKNFLLARTRRVIFKSNVETLASFWLLTLGIFLSLFFAIHSLVNGTGSIRHVEVLGNEMVTYAEWFGPRLAEMAAFSMQLMLFLSCLGVIAELKLVTVLVLMVLMIIHTISGYFGMPLSSGNPLVFFGSQGICSTGVEGKILWFGLTIFLLLSLLYQRFTRYQMTG